MKQFDNIDSYINAFPLELQKVLQDLRSLISSTVPAAQEAISYGMPTYKLNGNLVHFAMAKKHLGFYPGPSAIIAFKEALVNYHTSKGAIQLPLDQPLPETLIREIVRFRVAEQTDLWIHLSAPAKRALKERKIDDLETLSRWTEDEISNLHGIGKSNIPLLKAALSAKNLTFKSI